VRKLGQARRPVGMQLDIERGNGRIALEAVFGASGSTRSELRARRCVAWADGALRPHRGLCGVVADSVSPGDSLLPRSGRRLPGFGRLLAELDRGVTLPRRRRERRCASGAACRGRGFRHAAGTRDRRQGSASSPPTASLPGCWRGSASLAALERPRSRSREGKRARRPPRSVRRS